MTPTSLCCIGIYPSVTIDGTRSSLSGDRIKSVGGNIMAIFFMAAVGFVGMAFAMLSEGRDLNFENRQMAGVYRSRWA